MPPVNSQDPNALTGPNGFGIQNYLIESSLFGYEIFFQNETNATGPAQVVQINDPLSTNLDWTTFQLTEIDFGNTQIPIASGSEHYQNTFPVSGNGFNFQLQVNAGVNPVTGVVFADFTSVNPTNGLPPPAGVGFLPPEDGSGRGTGHVLYTIQPKQNLLTGTEITNVAFIQFDQNAVVATDQFNTNDLALVTIDNTPPASGVNPLPAIEPTIAFTVAWSGTNAGPAITAYNVFVATNGGPFTLWLANTNSTSATFAGQDGQAYAFYSQAIDGAGNTEPAHTTPDTTTKVVAAPPSIMAQPQGQAVSQGGNASFSVAATGGTPLYYQWQFNGTNIADATGTNYVLTGAQPFNGGAYSVVVSNASGVAVSASAELIVVSLSLNSGVNPSVYGNPVAFTATVQTNGQNAGAIAGETITFFNGLQQIGTGTLDTNGRASFITGPVQLLAGAASITAVYEGDTNYPATGAPGPLLQTINHATVTLTSGLTANNKIYDGTTTAALGFNNVALSGVIAGDTVSLNAGGSVANFAGAAVGSGLAVTVGGLTLTGPAAGNYALVQPILSANITPATLTILSGLTANSKVYNGTTTATLSSNSVALAGVVAGDTVSLSTSGYVANFAGAGVGTGVAVTVGGLSLTGASSGNYTLPQPAFSANITPAPVTILSGLTANSKIYNGTTTATLSSNNVVLAGVVAGDSVNLSTNGYVANFAGGGTSNGIPVTVGGLSLTGSAAANYALTQPVLSASITPAQVSVLSGLTVNNKVYDGTTTATITSNNVVLAGVIAGDAVNLSTNNYAANFAGTGVGNGAAVTVGGLSLTGAAAANYALAQPVLNANITTAPVTVLSGLTANNKVYDGTTTATIISNNVVLSGVVTGDAVNLSTNNYVANFAGTGVGKGVAVTVGGLSLSGFAAANYTLTQPVLSANITAAPVTVLSGLSANNKVYDGTTTATIISNNVVLVGVIAGDSVNLSTNNYLATFAGPGVGNGVAVTVGGLSLTGAAAANYALAQPVLSANITTAQTMVLSGLTANNKVYDGTTTATITSNNVVLAGVVAGDAVNLSTNNYAANFAGTGVGNGAAVTVGGLSLTGAAAANYALAQPVLNANITAAPVTVLSGLTAHNKVYDGTTTATITSNSVVLAGVVAGDAVNLSTNNYLATFAGPGVGNGVAVTVGGLSLTGFAASNYALAPPVLSANITAASVMVLSGLTANNKVYDGTTTATIISNSVALAGVVAGDAVNLSTNNYTAHFAGPGVGKGVVVTVGGLFLTGAAAENYALLQPVLSANITAAPVTILSGLTANNKYYDGTTTANLSSNNVTLSGVVASDVVILNINSYVAAFAGAGVGNGIAVSVGGLSLTGAGAVNYALVQPMLSANITVPGIEITVYPPNLQISWPTAATDFILAQTASLVPPIQWSNVTNTITPTGTNNAVLVSRTGKAQYFMLIASP